MAVESRSAFAPHISGEGLNITVHAGVIRLLNGVAHVPQTYVGLVPKADNFVYVNLVTGEIEVSLENFPANSFPIATVSTTLTKIQSLIDHRPDF